MRLGKVPGQIVHRALRGLAIGALQVGKLHQFQILAGGAARRPIGSLLQCCARLLEWMSPKRGKIALHGMFSIRRDQKRIVPHPRRLPLIPDIHLHLLEAGNRGRLNRRHAPLPVLINAPHGT